MSQNKKAAIKLICRAIITKYENLLSILEPNLVDIMFGLIKAHNAKDLILLGFLLNVEMC